VVAGSISASNSTLTIQENTTVSVDSAEWAIYTPNSTVTIRGNVTVINNDGSALMVDGGKV
jgi:phage gp45-like